MSADPPYFGIVKYLFFIIAFTISFIMMFNEKIEALGVSAYTIILFIFVVSTLVDIVKNYHPAKNLFLSSIGLSGSSVMTLAAAIIFSVAIAKLNTTFLNKGEEMKLSDTNRREVKHIENTFILSTVILVFLSVQTYFYEDGYFLKIINLLKQYVFSRKGFMGAALAIGILISVVLMYNISQTDGAHKGTSEYDFKHSAQELGLLTGGVFGYVVVYLLFIAGSLIAPTIFYMPQINIYLNGLFTLLLSGIAIYFLMESILPNMNSLWVYGLIALVAIIGLVDIFVGSSLLRLSGFLNVGGLFGNLGNYDLYSLINKIMLLGLFLFIFSKMFKNYRNLPANTPYKLPYNLFVVFTFLFFGVNLFSADRLGFILQDMAYIGIPIMAVLVGVYLLFLSNKIAPLWRNQVAE